MNTATTTTSPSQAPALLERQLWTGRIFSGEWRQAPTTIAVREPATGELIGEVGESQPNDLGKIVVRAQTGQAAWAATPAEERAALLRRAAQLLEADRNPLLGLIVRETGGLRGKAEGELQGAIDELIHSAAILIEPEGHILPSREPWRLSLARRVPLGLVGVIAPRTFRILLALP